MNKSEQEFAVESVLSIHPNAGFSIGETYESLTWLSTDTNKPTEKEFDDALVKVKSDWANNEYARQRAVAYPSVGDQLDMIYKDMKNSTTTHAEAVEAVKTKFPKE